MRFVTAAVAVAFLMGAGGAEAGLFGKRDKRKLPKPANWPASQSTLKAREDHKAGQRNGKHPKDYVLVLPGPSAATA